MVLPPELAEAARVRAEEWRATFGPRDPYEEWLVEQAAVAAVRLDFCVRAGAAQEEAQGRRAAVCWEEDRRAEVEALAARLAAQPARVIGQLRRSAQGCAWILVRWEGLGGALERNGRLDDAQRSLAADLLGLPAEIRGAEPRLAPDAPAEDLAALIREEIAALEARKADGLDDLEELARAQAAAGLVLDTSTEGRLLRRYEAACRRSLEWALAQLRRARANRPARSAPADDPPVTRPTTPPPPTSPDFDLDLDLDLPSFDLDDLDFPIPPPPPIAPPVAPPQSAPLSRRQRKKLQRLGGRRHG